MIVIYFCLDEAAPVMRLWPSAPRVGDTISLPELGGNLDPLKVYSVIWEGYDEPSVTVFLHRSRAERDSLARIAGESERDWQGP